MNPGLSAYELAYVKSPIILTNGIAAFTGGMLPIIALTEALNFTEGLLSGGDNIRLNDFFANFEPLPGSSLISNKIGMYPLANQNVAANAIIAEPLSISMSMMVPVREDGGYATKLATMMALQAALAQHNNSGGTYTIATPVFFYTNCVMTGMRDVSSKVTKQAQWNWQLDFIQPLLTLEQATTALNGMMSKITSGLPTTGALSGIETTIGFPPSLSIGSLAPLASGLPGTAVSGLSGSLPGPSAL
jgi:hypothetical protein